MNSPFSSYPARPASTVEQLGEQARRALQTQDEAALLPALRDAAARLASGRLWQWTALLLRALDRREEALEAFAEAQRLQPNDASIAHGRAHITHEAGLDAVALFERAQALAPTDGAVPLGLAAARLAAGDAPRAVADLDALLADRPGWIAGHEQLAQIRWMMGDHQGFADSYPRAIAAVPADEALWGSYMRALIQARAFDAAIRAVEGGRRALGASRTLDANEAVLRSEIGDADRADALFAGFQTITEPTLAVQHVRHLLRLRRLDQALPLIAAWLERPQARDMWPYAAIAWRLTDDPRYAWLDRQPGLVSVQDLTDRLPPLGKLADVLRDLHRARSQHLDQSVRGGTQTDGVLFANTHPLIAATREVIRAAVSAHIAQLPPRDPRHPTLAMRRDRPVRFAGSWSVRLARAGHHANHVHPAGWISSALYIALPERQPGEAEDAGRLTLGAPDADLGLHLRPEQVIAPAPGRLVLFPSTMWHGTVPFDGGERLTIAFDVAHPAA